MSDHQFDHPGMVKLFDRQRRHQLAVAKHRDSVRKRLDLVQFVRNVEDADGPRLEPGDERKKSLLLHLA